jgi:hypothetical protein
MVESPRRVDLRLTIPTAAPFAGVAGEVASRFAAYSGASEADADALRRAVDAATSQARTGSAESITFDLSVDERGLTVQSEFAGRTERVSCPLSS